MKKLNCKEMDKTSFKFSELSEDAKEYAIDKHYENEDYPFLKEDLEEELKNLDEKQYWSNVELCYSLSSCQGDGLCFKGKLSINTFLESNKKKYKLNKKSLEFLKNYIYSVYSKGNTSKYCYASENDVEWDENYSIEDILDEEQNEFKREIKKILYKDLEKKWIEEIYPDIKENYLEICKKLENYGYEVVLYRMDEKEFEDFSESNDYEYDEEGNLI